MGSPVNASVECWGGNNEYAQNDIPTVYNKYVRQVAVGDEYTCLVIDQYYVHKFNNDKQDVYANNKNNK